VLFMRLHGYVLDARQRNCESLQCLARNRRRKLGLKQAAQERTALDEFAPDFIPSLFRGELRVFTRPEDTERLLEGLRMAGFTS
jgi:hypothetical protein